MTKVTPDFPITKEFFTAWRKFRDAYTIVYESSLFALYCKSFNCLSPLAEKSMEKIITTSDLSYKLKKIAYNIILGEGTSKAQLILDGVITPNDLAHIKVSLLGNISGNTHCEQEKKSIIDYLTNGFEDKKTAPRIVLFNPLDYDTLNSVLSFKKVLNEDEENIVTLVMLGEMESCELNVEERRLFVRATNTLKEAYSGTDLAYYKFAVEYFLCVYPEKSVTDMCSDFSLNPARFRNVLRRNYPHVQRFFSSNTSGGECDD